MRKHTDISKLLIKEKDIRNESYKAIRQYAEADFKCIKHFDKNKESSYLKYREVNNLYG